MEFHRFLITFNYYHHFISLGMSFNYSFLILYIYVLQVPAQVILEWRVEQ